MNTDMKGEIGESSVIKDLMLKGYKVLQPLNKLEFDLVAYKDALFIKIQVKYCTKINGSLQIRLYTVSNGKPNIWYKDIDIIAVYSPELDKVLYLNFKDLNVKSEFRIRIDPTNAKNIHWWEDYLTLRV